MQADGGGWDLCIKVKFSEGFSASFRSNLQEQSCLRGISDITYRRLLACQQSGCADVHSMATYAIVHTVQKCIAC